MEADQRYNFDSNDLVIVQWTNTAREDRYLNDTGYYKPYIVFFN